MDPADHDPAGQRECGHPGALYPEGRAVPVLDRAADDPAVPDKLDSAPLPGGERTRLIPGC
jgi:hypothetical protein